MHRPRALARRLGLALVSVSLSAAVLAGPAPAAHAGLAVDARLVKGGLASPVGFTFSDAGKIFYVERSSGRVKVLNPQTGHERLFFHVRGVNAEGERGALGVALHPDYPTKPFVYVFATRATGHGLRNQVLRIKAESGEGVASKVILSSLVDDDTNHNGGRIAFGPDGKLYVVIGDGGGPTDPRHSQDLGDRRGKIHRINPNGSRPQDNPFDSKVWAYGIRNSIGFGWDPETNKLWESENGPECNDEINVIRKGGNYGWGPQRQCPDTNNSGPNPIQPKYTFVDTIGITGIAVCEQCGIPALDDHLVFGNVNLDDIRTVALNGASTDVTGTDQAIFTPDGPAISFETSPGGSIYFSTFSAIYELVPQS